MLICDRGREGAAWANWPGSIAADHHPCPPRPPPTSPPSPDPNSATPSAPTAPLRALAAEFAPPGTHFPVADLDVEDNVEDNVAALTGWFGDQWSQRAPATFNRHLDALRSAAPFWMDQGWLTSDPTRRLRRRLSWRYLLPHE
ncbi:hypothetical protein [Nonomuraea sp. NPDC049784]|uniref:hypothetical protein n=1 Tax=Nonomuraea sp. NPDC049784 TaxID=3154361 RepID=UPI0033D899EB